MRAPLLVATLLIACADSPSDDVPDASTPVDAGSPPACTPATCTFAAPVAWASPIKDYVATVTAARPGEAFEQAIFDLAVFDDRLYLGYGDATSNTGRVAPIEIRAFTSPDAASVRSEPITMAEVEGPQAATREEMVAVYRRFGDHLYVAGVDATEDAWLGNVFVRSVTEGWTRYRSITGGVHVHDVAEGFDGALYAVGSGALTPEAWNTGRVRSYLWKSVDGGATWSVASEIANLVPGDRRWTHLVAFGDELQLFGYRTKFTETGGSEIAQITHARWDGVKLASLRDEQPFFVDGTEPFASDAAFAWGVYANAPVHPGAAVVSPGGDVLPIEALTDRTVLDASQVGDAALLVLAQEGATYPRPASPTRTSVLYTEDLVTFRELVAWQPDVQPMSVAFWRGAIHVGLADGRILRAAPRP